MRVLFATAELAPLARVGGLAEAAAGLVRALREAGVVVDVVLPDYGKVELSDEEELHLDLPYWVGDARFRRGHHELAGEITLVRVPGIERPHPYIDEAGHGWPDNDHRFMGFSAAVAALADREQPDVLHLNDWHTSAAIGMGARPHPTVLTIHTLGYQGVMDGRWLDRLGRGADRFAWYGSANPLAGAIALADRVITVSPNYASEILTPEAGMGLHERLAGRGRDLIGIRNGIDTSIWCPTTDPHIAQPYSTPTSAGRATCREALAGLAGWEVDGPPIVGLVSRLVEQKGIDVLLGVVDYLPTMPARLLVLGSGETDLVSGLAGAAAARPETVWFFAGYDEPLAHQIFAGSDLFVMPSRFEPCGLAQMQAMVYGSIPVVTDVGGLHDTVVDADLDPEAGTGFVSPRVDPTGLVDALHRGVRALADPPRRTAIQRRGMEADWSWQRPATRHIELYEEVAVTR